MFLVYHYVICLVIVSTILYIWKDKAPLRGWNGDKINKGMSRAFKVLFFLLVFEPVIIWLDSWIGLNSILIVVSILYIYSFSNLSEFYCGRKKAIIRGCFLWNYLANRFQLKAVTSSEFHANEKYIFGVHPHSILPYGGLTFLMKRGEGGFSELCPEVNFKFLVASFCFYIPLYRDFLLFCGAIDASRFSAENALLDGYSIAVFPGGAMEALYSRPEVDVIVLKKRHGFIRLALTHGVSLVPIFTFNENNMFEQVGIKNFYVESLRKAFKNMFGISVPIIKNLIPLRTKVTCVVGEPIRVEKIVRPTEEDILRYSEIYIKSIEKIYAENSKKYNIPSDKPNIEII